MSIDFQHFQSAHCENGAVVNLLNHKGLKLSEPMVFGIGSGLFFAYLPFFKLNGIPVISYRSLPGWIFKRASKRLGIKFKSQMFFSEAKAMDALDRCLDQGIPVGMLSSVFYLPYLPKAFRFHFNAHNIVVYGKEGNEYLVSDSVMDNSTRIDRKDLIRARFAKGTSPPRGRMYYPTHIPEDIQLEKAIRHGIRWTSYELTHIPVPLFGLKGIHTFAKKVRTWPDKLGTRKASQYAGNVIRMQEEIGTGGAGFRFVYAAFLQEVAPIIGEEWLVDKAAELTSIGDRWREMAYIAGRICKGRNESDQDYNAMADIMIDCAEREYKLFSELFQKVKRRK